MAFNLAAGGWELPELEHDDFRLLERIPLILHRHCERSEPIQGRLRWRRGRLDCFIAIAPRNDASDSTRSETALVLLSVMAGLVPAIHVLYLGRKDVDARDKRGHDESK